jgi:hypothetical protein
MIDIMQILTCKTINEIRRMPVREVRKLDDECGEILRAAFNQICNPVDWKGPINAVVPACLADLYCEAIKFMTATDPVRFGNEDRGFVRLIALGYRAGPAGDH